MAATKLMCRQTEPAVRHPVRDSPHPERTRAFEVRRRTDLTEIPRPRLVGAVRHVAATDGVGLGLVRTVDREARRPAEGRGIGLRAFRQQVGGSGCTIDGDGSIVKPDIGPGCTGRETTGLCQQSVMLTSKLKPETPGIFCKRLGKTAPRPPEHDGQHAEHGRGFDKPSQATCEPPKYS